MQTAVGTTPAEQLSDGVVDALGCCWAIVGVLGCAHHQCANSCQHINQHLLSLCFSSICFCISSVAALELDCTTPLWLVDGGVEAHETFSVTHPPMRVLIMNTQCVAHSLHLSAAAAAAAAAVAAIGAMPSISFAKPQP
jgi:hypothetical protein